MDNWHYIAIGASLVLLIFTTWQEVRRSNKRLLLLRMLATFIAVVSLACMALPLTIRSNASPDNEAVLLTDGYNDDSVRAFVASQHKNIRTFTQDEFAAAGDSYTTLHVFGYGLSTDELAAIHDKRVVFHPSAINTGVTTASWQQTLQPGEKLHIQGSYNNATNTTVKLLLSGFNTPLDSVNIPANTVQRFVLGTVPKQAGKAVYTVTSMVNNKKVEEEPVPVEVTQADSLKVLILAASPDFENRFLKTWLSQNGCQVVVRTTTSTDKFNKEFLNIPSTSFDRVTPTLLDKFDAVISDASAFSALGKDEQNNIQSTVAGGLGLIVKADTALPSSAFFTQYFTVYSQPAKPQAASLQLSDGGVLHPLLIEQPLYIKTNAGTQALVTDSAMQTIVNSAIYGAGKIIVTTFNNTYNWMLTGNKDSYYNFWSELLSKAVKKKTTGESVILHPALPRVNQPLHTTFTGIGNALTQPLIGDSHIYLQQNTILPFNWAGSYWPTQTGWLAVSTPGNNTSLYVYSASDWRYITAMHKINTTRQFVSHQNMPGISINTFPTITKTPLSKIYFLIAFMVCCIFLWMEKKFNG